MSSSTKTADKVVQGVFSLLKPEDLIRGKTPADIGKRCQKICADYIGGQWASARVEDLTVTRITGGISNQVYRVQLLKNTKSHKNSKEPTDVSIKLYNSKRLLSHAPEDPERLADTVVLTVLSEVRLGPKVYGIFADGFVQQWVEHQKFGPVQMKDPGVVRQVAHALAKLHSLNVPINKSAAYWNLRQAEDMLAAAYRDLPVEKIIRDAESPLPALSKYDIRKDIVWLRKTIEELNPPLVFSHNDFLGNNILLTEPKGEIALIDLEYASYGSRGFDLSVLLSQWGLAGNDYENLDMPEEAVMEHFLTLYLEGAEKLAMENGESKSEFASKRENSLKYLLYETKLMLCLFFLFWSAFHLNQREALIEAIPFDMKVTYRFAENYYGKIQAFKTRLGEKP